MQCLKVSLRVILWGLVVLVASIRDVQASVRRYHVATPHTPVQDNYKYIPLHNNQMGYGAESSSEDFPAQDTTPSGLAPSELILTVFRTALDVVRGINARRKVASKAVTSSNATVLTPLRSNLTEAGRGFEDYYDDHHDHHETTTTPKPMKQSRYTDPWAGYYDFLINEGSFKFWSIFQLFTAAVLFYACLSAIYYAKFNPIIPDYDREYDDYFLERTVGRKARSIEPWLLPSGSSWINPTTFQFILDAISHNYGKNS